MMRRHAFAVVLALAACAFLLGLAVVTAGGRAPAGRVLALAAPWEREIEVVGRLAASGAEWVLPLWLPGAWLAEMRPGGPPRGVLLFPLGEGWAWLPGCAPARPAPRIGA
jgi:hypothetical protein